MTEMRVRGDIQAFANRLRKNAKHWSKWARRQDVECYRVYDRDIPEFPLTIDLYGSRVHLQEFKTGWEISEEEHTRWVAEVKQATAEVLQLPAHAVYFKLRARQKGLAQYEKTGAHGEDFVVREAGLGFIVNLEDYLDTGLFLDHRNTRMIVRERAADKRFLNLFAYTGSFTVYAAAGGARESVTVDLSNTYQDWARRNFQLNHMNLAKHFLVRADVLIWLENEVAAGEKYDLIVMDPPTFSNSKKMLDILDVQRDHPRLINQCLALLPPAGELFFSTNLRSFELEQEKLSPCAEVREISHLTVPEDFRNKKIHRCWRLIK